MELINPRTEYDNLSKMYCFHNRYKLGDKHFYHPNDFTCFEEFEDQLMRDFDIAVILPLYLYDHGGITISTSTFVGRAHHAHWDSGQVGYVFVTKQDARKEYGWQRMSDKRVQLLEERIIEPEVTEYDKYLRGEQDTDEEE